MRVKNISKKVIGNESFQLLPDAVMEVCGDEAWVRKYLGRNKLKVISGPVKEDWPEELDPEDEEVALAKQKAAEEAAAAKQKAAEEAAAAKQKAAEARALKKARNDILKSGDMEAIKQLADELKVSYDENVIPEELEKLIKAAM